MNIEIKKQILNSLQISYIPQNLGPRSTQYEMLQNFLVSNSQLMIITGNPSCGKTTVIQRLLFEHNSLDMTNPDTIYEVKRNHQIFNNKKLFYINCAKLVRQQQVTQMIAQIINRQHKFYTVSNSLKYLNQISLQSSQKNQPVIILDEYDYLSESNILIILNQLPCKLILISNTLITKQNEKIKSRFNLAIQLKFQDYNRSELLDILQIRLQKNIKYFDQAALRLLALRCEQSFDCRKMLFATQQLILQKQNDQNISCEQVQNTLFNTAVNTLSKEQIQVLRYVLEIDKKCILPQLQINQIIFKLLESKILYKDEDKYYSIFSTKDILNREI